MRRGRAVMLLGALAGFLLAPAILGSEEGRRDSRGPGGTWEADRGQACCRMHRKRKPRHARTAPMRRHLRMRARQLWAEGKCPAEIRKGLRGLRRRMAARELREMHRRWHSSDHPDHPATRAVDRGPRRPARPDVDRRRAARPRPERPRVDDRDYPPRDRPQRRPPEGARPRASRRRAVEPSGGHPHAFDRFWGAIERLRAEGKSDREVRQAARGMFERILRSSAQEPPGSPPARGEGERRPLGRRRAAENPPAPRPRRPDRERPLRGRRRAAPEEAPSRGPAERERRESRGRRPSSESGPESSERSASFREF